MRRLGIAVLLLAIASSAFAAIPAAELAERRAKLAKELGANAIFIALSAEPATRNADVEWPFRQEDDLLYLTGVNAPNTRLVLIPGESALSEAVFVRDRNPSAEVWTGKIPSSDEVTASTGAKNVYSIRQFDMFLAAAFLGRPWGPSEGEWMYRSASMPATAERFRAGKTEVWLLLRRRPRPGDELTPELKVAEELRKRFPEIAIRDASPILTRLRQIKSDAEIATIRRAVEITVEAQKASMRRALTATRENELQATIEAIFRERGACCWSFPSIVASGSNATVLHYESNDAAIPRDGLVLTDLGAEVDGYAADVTRTYPADGAFSDAQRAIHRAVYRAQSESIEMMRPGRALGEINAHVLKVLGEELLRLGLVTKNDRDQVKMYVLHNFSHHVGLQVHDTAMYAEPLARSMVVVSEPGVYVRKNDVLANPAYTKLSADDQKEIAAMLEKYDGIGVRIEDTLVITDRGATNLSAGAPRSDAEIEAFMAKVASDGP